MTRRRSDHGLEFLLAFDGRIHHLEKGYWLKFEIRRGECNQEPAAWLVLFVHASRAGWDETGWLRQCARCAGQGLAV